MPASAGANQGGPLMNAETTLQSMFDDLPPADDTRYSSRLRAVWMIGVADGESAVGAADEDLVEVTPAFAWVS
jgi:hypothetical protein